MKILKLYNRDPRLYWWRYPTLQRGIVQRRSGSGVREDCSEDFQKETKNFKTHLWQVTLFNKNTGFLFSAIVQVYNAIYFPILGYPGTLLTSPSAKPTYCWLRRPHPTSVVDPDPHN